MKKIVLSICFLGTAILGNAQVVSTLAGSSSGFQNGTGTSAMFSLPIGVCFDQNGNIMVADQSNYKIRKVTPSGDVTTFAGSTNGYSDGMGTSAMFKDVYGICNDANGNIYLTETLANRIRKITPDGTVTTFAGSVSGAGGDADGIGTLASFNGPYGICADHNGNVYVTDLQNNKIKRITPEGVVTTLFSYGSGDVDGYFPVAKLHTPGALCTDSNGNIYVSDTYNHKIKKITTDGHVETIAGSSEGYAEGNGSLAKFDHPAGICIDASGTLYVADKDNNRIRVVTQDGDVSTLAGSGPGYLDGTGTAAKFSLPVGISIDAIGSLYVADLSNYKIRKITQALGVNGNKYVGFNVTIYPNPTSDVLNIKSDKLFSNTQISITDVLGKKLYDQKVEGLAVSVNTSNYPKGLYFVTIADDTMRSTQKVIIQ